VNADEQKHLLDNLQSLLEKQIEMARKGNFRHVEVLAERAAPAIEKIAKIKSFGRPEFDERRKHLVKLYQKLELMLEAEKASVGRQQRQVDNVRKILKAYRNSG
jgi:DNA primase catalytic subunit